MNTHWQFVEAGYAKATRLLDWPEPKGLLAIVLAITLNPVAKTEEPLSAMV
jgi:hypothetical protein